MNEGGFESFPSLYADGLQVSEFSAWSRTTLEERVTEYDHFLQRPDIMPRAQSEASRIMGHLVFELTWRDENGEV